MNRARQLSLDDQGTPLAEVEMVVVDLETTGTDPVRDAITEIGAVRVRGGAVLGEFRTFVNPGRPIPAAIAALTGITDTMVTDAPTIQAVLPMFLDFARGAVLVAHNARFDIGFLKAQSAAIDEPWPSPQVLDTLTLARRAFGRDEVRNHRLSTLAAHVGARATPDHRALSDARATVDVLHATIERLGPAAATLEDLLGAHRRVTPVQMRKKHLTQTVPSAPGVYRFLDRRGGVLYVGTSQNMRSRVRTYFTAAENRRAVLDMLPLAESISTLECVSPLEAAVLELREIAAHQPPANRRSRRPDSALWLRLDAPGPRGTQLRAARIARDEADGGAQIGPLRSRQDLEPLKALLTSAVLGQSPGSRSVLDRDDHHARLRRAMLEDPGAVLEHIGQRMRAATAAARYERAQALRELAESYIAAVRRADRLRALAACPRLIAVRPGDHVAVGARGWEMIAVDRGRLRAAGLALPGEDPLAAVARMMDRALPAGAQAAGRPQTASDELSGTAAGNWAQLPAPGPLCQGHHQESELIADWLASDGVRIVQVEGEWASGLLASVLPEAIADAFRVAATP